MRPYFYKVKPGVTGVIGLYLGKEKGIQLILLEISIQRSRKTFSKYCIGILHS